MSSQQQMSLSFDSLHARTRTHKHAGISAATYRAKEVFLLDLQAAPLDDIRHLYYLLSPDKNTVNTVS